MRSIPPAGYPQPGSRPLTGGEILIVVIIMILATVLTVAGLPMFGIIELLGGTAAVILHLLRPTEGGSSSTSR
ncbi:hypothetical protein ABT236_35090 [Streptomyces sp. NPDC001523]|uniref:hypothetical protein n=1 Tax=Streptomyces sp. NPDC001523 TaxID=3154383 RepID=UPI00332C61EC